MISPQSTLHQSWLRKRACGLISETVVNFCKAVYLCRNESDALLDRKLAPLPAGYVLE